ncbi:hypothetical protein OIV83_006155 [Microbotryomycetes sp. JL201]|nr:hypothetical protein OIV83_006155 [Microbotryomycetes sp. JL201]
MRPTLGARSRGLSLGSLAIVIAVVFIVGALCASALPASAITASARDGDSPSSLQWLDHDLTDVQAQTVYDKIPASSRVVLIRHAEKPKHDKPGLSRKGVKRAQCLRKALGPKSKYDFGLIIAQSYNSATGMRKRPYDTVKPLADDLGIPVRTDERDDPACVIRIINEFSKHEENKGKDVLICWKHSFLHVIARALGSQTKSKYPDDRYDILWVMQNRKIISKEAEHCPKLDKQHKAKNDKQDPDLQVSEDGVNEDWLSDQVEQMTLGNRQ